MHWRHNGTCPDYETFVWWIWRIIFYPHVNQCFTYRYIDDVLSINNPEFEYYPRQMYPAELDVKLHSDRWPTVTSQLIRLSTNFMTFIPSLTFTDYEWFPRSICNGCGMPAWNAYPSGHLVPPPIVGLACAPIVKTRFLELAMSLLDFSPRILLGTFSVLLMWVLRYPTDIFVNGKFETPLKSHCDMKLPVDDR